MKGILSITKATRTTVRVSLFKKAHARILPATDVSLVFISPQKALEVNIALRNKSYVPNVLSYMVGKRSGEVLLCASQIKKEAKSYGLTYEQCLLFMFIHALLHLKGMRHGTTMERAEARYLALYFANTPLYETKTRRRH